MFGSIGKAIGGAVSGIIGQRNNNRAYNLALDQFNFSKDMARNQIQWRVEDAKKAGVHPMAALGLSPSSFSPVSIPSASPIDMNWLGELGQEADRAIQQGKTKDQRDAAWALQERQATLGVREQELKNEALEMDIAEKRFRLQQQLFPAPPPVNQSPSLIGGQGDALPHGRSLTGDAKPLLGAARVGDSLLLHINPDIADSITEDWIRTQVANIAAEGQVHRYLPELAEKLTKQERDAIARGDAELLYTPPSQFKFAWKSHMMPRKNRDGSISGKIIW